MTGEKELWKRSERLLLEALERPKAARARFLDRVCGDDRTLRREVGSLLAAAEEAGNFLDEPAASWRSGGEEIGERRCFGPWQVRREIGRGGMGTVYLAARADDAFTKQVAVKLLKRGMDTDEIVARFRHERQILAQLEHPGIARLLDGGSTGDGLPYFVMEYVEGEPIDRYCDRRKLSIRRRIELFRRVCSAVHFAHRNLVVHRDLKPGNILVGADGEPKLLDFGIAKLLEPGPSAAGAAAATRWTTLGVRPMTPAYASPEQVSGGVVTTSSDVYALGVLLFELLTGRRPYRLADGSLEELERAICEQESAKPSTAVRRWPELRSSDDDTAAPGTPESVSATRGGDPRSLSRRLAGDLDAIVLTALAKDPQQRYASVEQLSEDLRYHLQGLPVVARKPTLAYQAGKFVRRHRLGTAMAAAVLALILGFAVTATVLRNEAERERERAEEVSNFLVDLFQLPDPRQSRGETVTARRLLDEAAKDVRKELEHQGEDRTTLMGAIGSAYLGLKLYDEAEPLLEESLRRRRQESKGHGMDRELVVDLLNLAAVRREKGSLAAAAELEREASDLVRPGRLDQPRLARFLNNKAGMREYRGELQAAEVLYREALAMKLRLFGEVHPEVARGQQNLAALLVERGELGEAEGLYRRALAQRTKLHGRVSPEVAKTLGALALVLQNRGDLAAAEPLLRESLEIRIELYGPEHPAVGTAHNNLAFLLKLRGALEEAEDRYREALSIFRKSYGPEHVNVAVILRNRAELRRAMGDPSGAEAEVRRALSIYRRAWPDGHWRIADAESVLGGCLAAQGRVDEAGPLLLRGYAELRSAKGEKARQTLEARERLERFSG